MKSKQKSHLIRDLYSPFEICLKLAKSMLILVLIPHKHFILHFKYNGNDFIIFINYVCCVFKWGNL